MTTAKTVPLLLIDEIASGTNPVEGLALTRSLVDYLIDKPYITLITTHFEAVTEENGVRICRSEACQAWTSVNLTAS